MDLTTNDDKLNFKESFFFPRSAPLFHSISLQLYGKRKGKCDTFKTKKANCII